MRATERAAPRYISTRPALPLPPTVSISPAYIPASPTVTQHASASAIRSAHPPRLRDTRRPNPLHRKSTHIRTQPFASAFTTLALASLVAREHYQYASAYHAHRTHSPTLITGAPHTTSCIHAKSQESIIDTRRANVANASAARWTTDQFLSTLGIDRLWQMAHGRPLLGR